MRPVSRTPDPPAPVKYKFATKPRPHQVPALKFLARNRGGGLQVPMRWGKTKIAIDWANIMHLKHGAKRVLVVCPVSVIGVWENEVPKHTPDGIDLEWRITNYEAVYDRQYVKRGRRRSWYPIPNVRLEDYAADIIIVDESHNIGNPEAVTSKMLYHLGRRARFRLIMTGTMFHRKPFYVFGQARFMDPTIYGSNFGAFKKRVAVFGGYGGYEIIRYQNLKWMVGKLKPYVWIEKYVPPGEPVINELRYDLTGRGAATYLEMEKESMIEVAGEDIKSTIPITRHLRLQQIASGWVRTQKGYHRVGNDALKLGMDRMQTYMDNDVHKVVVGCRFIPELYDAAYAARAAGYSVILLYGRIPKGRERTRRWQAFANTSRPTVFVAQMQTAKEGIDLSAADTMLFWGLSESYVTHDQFTRRIERYGDTRTLVYDYMIPRRTRTEVTYAALQEKEDVARFIVERPELVEAITSKEDT